MPPASNAPSSGMAPPRRVIASCRRTLAPQHPHPPSSPPQKKMKLMSDILATARYAVLEGADYNNVKCEQCGSGERAEELLLCDKCDKGFHMKCLMPIVVRVPIGSWLCYKCSGQRRVRRLSQKKIIDFFRIQRSWFDQERCRSLQDLFVAGIVRFEQEG